MWGMVDSGVEQARASKKKKFDGCSRGGIRVLVGSRLRREDWWVGCMFDNGWL